MCRICIDMNETVPAAGDMRVWWIPQVPMKSFQFPVKSIREAKLLLSALADYDEFQLFHNIKPDFSNAGGLVIYDLDSNGEGNPGWIEWTNEDGEDIDNVDDDGKTLEEP